MLIQLLTPGDLRRVADVDAYYRSLGYRPIWRCRRGRHYLELWQETPDLAERSPLPAIHGQR
ncbi:hypothetical protein [Chitinimonas lacunae]|uniref:Uncharacterized protein n=1 Tax=Chitinimonas lacunae TaxID=1963018 RepID=A0ABV8MWF4_9NEIS